MRKIKQEQGSIAVYISVVVLSMLLILFAVFLTSSSKIKAQVETTLAVKQSYEADNKKAGEIYKELVGTGGEEEEPQYVQTGLILHYDAIENTENGHSTSTTTWKDLSGNGNDGTIVGGTWTDRSLKFTSSNTSNGVRTSQNFPIDFENTFNIVFKLNKVNNVDVLFGSRTTSSNGFMLFNYSTTNALTFDTKGSGTRVSLGSRLSENKTYDITVTFSGTTANLYVNGELSGTKTFTDASLNMPLSIFTANSQSNAVGNIYSVKVYNRALTADEVKQNYDIDKEKYGDKYVTDGLVLHYDAIDNTGNGHSTTTTTWKDLSGNGNDGTLSTAPNTSNFYWEDNSITISGYSSGSLKYYVDTPLKLSGQARTYIYTVDARNLTGSIWGETDDSNRNGLFNYQNFISNRGNSTSGDNRYNYTFAKSGIYSYAVTVSSSQIKFYANGALVTTINNTNGLNCSNPLRLLAARYSSQNASNLKMYNFMAYNRVLSETEIQQNYNIIETRFGI